MKCPKCNFENPDTVKFCSECGTQFGRSEDDQPSFTKTLETPVEELTRGTVFADRYEIIEELGKGGMGKVYRVEDSKLEQEVALKLIKPDIAKDKKTIERFRNELKLARNIRHKNVCGMYDLGETARAHFITMEYVRGEDLRSAIRRFGQLPIGKSISIAKQICDGLSEAHRLGIVHRDLKSNNIMLDKEGNVRIMDFGIARSLEAKGITGVGVMIGTPEYMSPEQIEGKEVDQRTDLYSLGIILYEMVTGRVPFEGDTPFTIGMKHKGETPKNPKEFNAQISDDLVQVILRCLEKEKENRYQSAGEIRTELERVERGIPTTERILPERKPLTSREVTVTFGLKKIWIPVVAIIAIAAISVAIWQLFLTKKISSLPIGEASLAVMYFENRTEVLDLDKILVDMLTTNLSRIEGIEVVSSQRLFDILKQLGKQDIESIDKSTATQVATQAGVKTMLTGSIIKVGEKVRIASNLTDVQTGNIIGSEQVEGETIDEDVFTMVDDLTVKISTHMGLFSEGEPQELKIADVTTNSLEAYKHYQKGLDYLMRFRRTPAAREFQKAIDLDPTFALAYAFMTCAETVYGNSTFSPLFDLAPVRKKMEIAKKYSHKATEKEQMLIKLQAAFFSREYELSRSIGEKLIEKYPDYKYGYYYLLFVEALKQDFINMKNACERILEVDPTEAGAYNMLAYGNAWQNNPPGVISAIKKYKAVQPDEYNPYDSAWETLMMVGHYDEAVAYLEEYISINPDWISFHRDIGSTFLLNGDSDRAREKYLIYEESTSRKDLAARYMGYSFLFEGRYGEAEDEFRQAVGNAQEQDNEWNEMNAFMDLGRILVIQKKYSEAIEEYNAAIKLSWKSYSKDFNPIPILIDYLMGLAHVQKGDYKAVQSLAQDIQSKLPEFNNDILYQDFYNLLMGELYYTQGNLEQLQAALEKVSSISKLWSMHYRRLAAGEVELMGNLEETVDGYQIFYNSIGMITYSLPEQFYYFREASLINYRLGKIYEQQGDTIKAIEHFKKFLTFWKNADPGIAEIEDAKERLAGLKK